MKRPHLEPGAAEKLKLTRIQFDDQRFVDIVSDFVAVWQGLESTFHFLRINRNPRWHAALFCQRQSFNDTYLLLGLFANGNYVAWLHLVRSDVDHVTVDGERLVRDN